MPTGVWIQGAEGEEGGLRPELYTLLFPPLIHARCIDHPHTPTRFYLFNFVILFAFFSPPPDNPHSLAPLCQTQTSEAHPTAAEDPTTP